jgi:methylenetetrahydrofolate dehydrogenase (NADP+)/methenyltetrahydrofolate cyclohydrolase
MTAKMLTGKEPADALMESLKSRIAAVHPKLVIVQVGNNAGSNAYVSAKLKACEKAGIHADLMKLSEGTTFEEIVAVVHALNIDDNVNGFIIQLPLPQELQEKMNEIAREIKPQKDVDGFTARNLGKVFISHAYEHLPPATPAGVISLLEFYNIPVEGKHCVIVGRSNLVGKPLSIMLLNRGATVTVCHSKTEGLASHTKQADVLCSAVGLPGIITKDMVKTGAVVIDIGIAREDEGLKGDASPDVAEVASAMTPVPKGVGPMTVASLLRNCVMAAERQEMHRRESAR